MGVPATMEDLNITNAAFGETAGVEATSGKGPCLPCFLAVEFESRFLFVGEIHQLGDRSLHTVGHLMLFDTRENLGVPKSIVLTLVESSEGVELGPAIGSGNAL